MGYPEYWRRVACRDWYETENKIWMCLSDKNAICEIDKRTNKVRVIGSYPKKGISEPILSATVIGLSEKIVFVPLAADDIAVYDKENDELIFIPIKRNRKKHHEIFQENMKFRRAFAYKDSIFLLGHSYPAIIQLNINTLDINYLTEWIDIIEPYIEKGDSLGYFKEGYSLYDTQIYLPLGCCSGLMKIELEKMQFEYIPIQAGINGFGSLTDINGMFYMTGRSGREHEIIIWNKYTGAVRKVEIPMAYYHAPIVYDEKILLFPFNGNSVIILKDNTYLEEYRLPKSSFPERNTPDIKIMAVKYFGKVLKIEIGGERKWYEFNLGTNTINEFIYNIESEEFLSQAWKEYCDVKVQKMLREKIAIENLPIKEYFIRIADSKFNDSKEKEQLGNNGKTIWKKCKT